MIDTPQSVDELEDQLSEPTELAVAALRDLAGDILVLGAGGKMGPTLARMARRASDAAGVNRRVIAVSRFSESGVREKLERLGVETIPGDLLDDSFVGTLPEAANIVYMAGFKFGAASQPWMTWAMNCYLPALICRRFPNSRIVAFSTGNVYGLVPVDGPGSVETDEPNPVGEYAMAALGRERMFEYFSRSLGIPTVTVRLNYATELRYGVLVDLAQQVFAEETIDLTMGRVNVIWQTDANAMALELLAHAASPPKVVNVAGSEILSVRHVATEIGRLLGKSVQFHGQEAESALISNGSLAHKLLEPPTVRTETMLAWTADWIARGGETLGKPTKFQNREGKF